MYHAKKIQIKKNSPNVAHKSLEKEIYPLGAAQFLSKIEK